MKLRVLAATVISFLTISAHALPFWNSTVGYGPTAYDAYWNSVQEARNDCKPDVMRDWEVIAVSEMDWGYQATIRFNCHIINR